MTTAVSSIVVPRVGASPALEALFRAHYAWVWRTLRRLGVAEPAVDDSAQAVFLVASANLDRIAVGRERAYLTGVALRIAANARRSDRRRRDGLDAAVEDPGSKPPDPEELLDQKQRRELLDGWLDALPLELRAPFVLFEIEGLSLLEIADALDVPLGTIKTRLRRARQLFLETASVRGDEP
jgi:RNA polymerase sigma-70 factor, ECF subfamily